MAAGEGRTAMDVAPDSDHGTDRPSGYPEPSGRSPGAGKGPRPTRPASVVSLRCHRHAPLASFAHDLRANAPRLSRGKPVSTVPDHADYPPAILSRGRPPRSMAR